MALAVWNVKKALNSDSKEIQGQGRAATAGSEETNWTVGHATVEGIRRSSHETILAYPAIIAVADHSTPDYSGAGGCPTGQTAGTAAASRRDRTAK
jgi:hypothetical protein